MKRMWLAALLLLTGTAAIAASWDTDGDGVLSKEEIAARLEARIALFKHVDKNHDGFVDLDELYAVYPGNGGADAVVQMKFVRDDNFDGQLNEEEWTEAERRHMDMAVEKCDVDKDGVLKAAEITCAERLPW
jgi:Ca2+-binding EF-hand superfamily protein